MAILTRTNIVTNGLVMYLDAANKISYPGTGTTWFDMSGNSKNGTTSGATYGSQNGGVFNFDGVNDTIAQGDSVAYGSTGNLISNSSVGPVTNAMGFVSSKIHYRNYDGAWKSNSGNTTLSTGQWYMLTWVNYAGASANLGTMKMFVNGQSDSSVFNSYTTNGGPCNAIGRNWFSHFNGRIGLVQFYNVSLTDSQVFENFNAHRYRYDI